MAIPHIRVSAYSRKRQQSVIAHAAYCSGAKLTDSDGEKKDFSRKSGIVFSDILSFDGKKIDRNKYWLEKETLEKRKDACLGREILCALPIELDAEKRQHLAIDLAKIYIKYLGVDAADISIHEPKDNRKWNSEEKENPHAHILVADRDKNGNKLRIFNGTQGQKTIKEIRKIFETTVNNHLKLAGIDEIISVDRLEKQISDIDIELNSKQKELSDVEKFIQILRAEIAGIAKTEITGIGNSLTGDTRREAKKGIREVRKSENLGQDDADRDSSVITPRDGRTGNQRREGKESINHNRDKGVYGEHTGQGRRVIDESAAGGIGSGQPDHKKAGRYRSTIESLRASYEDVMAKLNELSSVSDLITINARNQHDNDSREHNDDRPDIRNSGPRF